MDGLAIEHLNAGYGQRLVLTDVSLSVARGQTIALMGPSGSGKTTLLLAILGIINPSSGTISLGTESLTALPIEERNIGYVPQDYGLFPHLTVGENIAYGLRIRHVTAAERQRMVQDMLRLVDLPAFASRRVMDLSGGQRQRVALARALAIRQHLLLLDEPLSNIDRMTKAEVGSQLRELLERLDIPVLLVTHNPEDAMLLARALAIMVNGRIVQNDSTARVRAHPSSKIVEKLLAPLPIAL